MALVRSCRVKLICVLKVRFHTTVGAKLDVLQGDRSQCRLRFNQSGQCRWPLTLHTLLEDSQQGSLSPNVLNVTRIPHVPEENSASSGEPCRHVCSTHCIHNNYDEHKP